MGYRLPENSHNRHPGRAFRPGPSVLGQDAGLTGNITKVSGSRLKNPAGMTECEILVGQVFLVCVFNNTTSDLISYVSAYGGKGDVALGYRSSQSRGVEQRRTGTHLPEDPFVVAVAILLYK